MGARKKVVMNLGQPPKYSQAAQYVKPKVQPKRTTPTGPVRSMSQTIGTKSAGPRFKVADLKTPGQNWRGQNVMLYDKSKMPSGMTPGASKLMNKFMDKQNRRHLDPTFGERKKGAFTGVAGWGKAVVAVASVAFPPLGTALAVEKGYRQYKDVQTQKRVEKNIDKSLKEAESRAQEAAASIVDEARKRRIADLKRYGFSTREAIRETAPQARETYDSIMDAVIPALKEGAETGAAFAQSGSSPKSASLIAQSATKHAVSDSIERKATGGGFKNLALIALPIIAALAIGG